MPVRAHRSQFAPVPSSRASSRTGRTALRVVPAAMGNQTVQRVLQAGAPSIGQAPPQGTVLRQEAESPRGRLTAFGLCDLREATVENPPPCRFTEGERIILNESRQRAALRARSAHLLWIGRRGPIWQSHGRALARRIFNLQRLPVQHITDTLDHIATRLEDRGLPMVCAPCRDHGCIGGVGAYVNAARQPPIHICPLFFSDLYQYRTVRTLIHEVAHLEGVDIQRRPPETYCEEGDPCTTPCHGIDVADAWGHFVSCYGREVRL